MPSPETPAFFKLMLGNFKTTMRIPPAFKKHLLNSSLTKAVLVNTSAAQWQVKVRTVDDSFFFQEGWQRFISDNNISSGDFLYFFYDGSSTFHVNIYGKSACERDTVKTSVAGCEAESRVVKKATSSYKKKRTVIEVKSKQCVTVARTKEKIENVKMLEAACSFETENLYFVATCTNVQTRCMDIPKELDELYNLAQKKSVILQDPVGRSRNIKVWHRKDGRVTFTTGWSKMYRENCLKEGDACILEFIEGGHLIVQLHIFRVEDYTAKPNRRSARLSSSSRRS